MIFPASSSAPQGLSLRQALADPSLPYRVRLQAVEHASIPALLTACRTKQLVSLAAPGCADLGTLRHGLIDRVITQTADVFEARVLSLRAPAISWQDLMALRTDLQGVLLGIREGMTSLVLPDPYCRDAVLRGYLCSRTSTYFEWDSERVQVLCADVIDLACHAEMYLHRWQRLVDSLPGGWQGDPWLKEELEAYETETGQPLQDHPLTTW